MERWEKDAIERRLDRLEEAGWKTEERLRKFEWRDGMRVHLNIVVMFWMLSAAIVLLEIATIAVKA
jgi:hypothetical protein